MSKSLGNSPDPLDLIAKYGADALRFSIMRIAPSGTDVRFIENNNKDDEGKDYPQVEEGRNFANKLWNAARFRQMQGSVAAISELPEIEKLSIYDIDILQKLDSLNDELSASYSSYKFQEIANRLYEFFWSEFCDWYLESIKLCLRDDANESRKQTVLIVVDTVLAGYLTQLHPYMPHITEELWEKLGYSQDEEELLMQRILSKEKLLDRFDKNSVQEAGKKTNAIHEATTRARHIKAQYNLAANRNVKFYLQPQDNWVADELDVFKLLSGAGEIIIDDSYEASTGTPTFLTPIGKMFMPLEGLVDIEAEKIRINKEIDKTDKDLKQVLGKLSNSNFTERAPAEIVQENIDRKDSLRQKLEQLQEMLQNLS